MTYKELIEGLRNAMRFTEGVEAAAAAHLKRQEWLLAESDITEDELLLEGALRFIDDEVADAEARIGDNASDEAQSAYQNALDTVLDYGVDFDSPAGKLVFANSYNIETDSLFS